MYIYMYIHLYIVLFACVYVCVHVTTAASLLSISTAASVRDIAAAAALGPPFLLFAKECAKLGVELLSSLAEVSLLLSLAGYMPVRLPPRSLNVAR